jgi:hypothetical protein
MTETPSLALQTGPTATPQRIDYAMFSLPTIGVETSVATPRGPVYRPSSRQRDIPHPATRIPMHLAHQCHRRALHIGSRRVQSP